MTQPLCLAPCLTPYAPSLCAQVKITMGDLLASIGDEEAASVRGAIRSNGRVAIDPDTVTVEGMRLLQCAFSMREVRIPEDKVRSPCPDMGTPWEPPVGPPTNRPLPGPRCLPALSARLSARVRRPVYTGRVFKAAWVQAAWPHGQGALQEQLGNPAVRRQIAAFVYSTVCPSQGQRDLGCWAGQMCCSESHPEAGVFALT